MSERTVAVARSAPAREHAEAGGQRTVGPKTVFQLPWAHFDARNFTQSNQVAIVALGRTQKLPRFDANGNVVERAILTVSWAGDHRIIDGGTIARFCNRWKSYLESPQSMLLHLG